MHFDRQAGYYKMSNKEELYKAVDYKKKIKNQKEFNAHFTIRGQRRGRSQTARMNTAAPPTQHEQTNLREGFKIPKKTSPRGEQLRYGGKR